MKTKKVDQNAEALFLERFTPDGKLDDGSSAALERMEMTRFIQGYKSGHESRDSEVKELTEIICEKQVLIGKMDAALIRAGINFDFHKATLKPRS